MWQSPVSSRENVVTSSENIVTSSSSENMAVSSPEEVLKTRSLGRSVAMVNGGGRASPTKCKNWPLFNFIKFGFWTVYLMSLVSNRSFYIPH